MRESKKRYLRLLRRSRITVINAIQVKYFIKKGRKSIIIRNGNNFPLNGFGFQTENGNSIIKFHPTSKTFDFIVVLSMIRICNMESRKIAALLQHLVNEFEEKLEIIRKTKIKSEILKKQT